MDIDFANYLIKKVRDDYNEGAEQFSRARQFTWKEMNFLFDNYLQPGDKVLDLGCGNGRFYEVFKGKKVEYFGIDNCEALINIAKEKYPEGNFKLADAISLPFPNEFFDKVYAIALLHHIPSNELRLKVLTEARRVLKKGGILIITVWNLWQKSKTRRLIFEYSASKLFGKDLRKTFPVAPGKLELDFKDILMEWQGVENCYFHCFTKRELKKLIRKASFNIIKDGEILVGSKKKKSNIPNSNFFVVAEK
ncbi:MAG TPA: class I SAM-dependent methyltransferase [Candidatus Pacearchaeota archaeon]|nr:class I SAM-dependent methyltransferase [Candidatus Pacearchaeota archaeon]